MTVIHQCDRCDHQGRVVELATGYLCEPCYSAQRDHERESESCPTCGREGVTDTGLCYPCSHSPDGSCEPVMLS